MPHLTSTIQSKKISAYNIKPVTTVQSRLVHHYHDVLSSKQGDMHRSEDTLLHQLIVERDRAKKTIREHSKDLAHQVIQVIKQYNALIDILIKVEEKEGCQVDQALQHFLVFHKPAFSTYGISVRQFLFLEYDPIVMKHQIAKEGIVKSHALLIGSKGIITDLFYLFDRLVSSLNTENASANPVHLLDIKA